MHFRWISTPFSVSSYMNIISDIAKLKSHDLVELKCERCEKQFFSKKRIVLDKRRILKSKNHMLFCSRGCLEIHSGNRILCKCAQCDKDVCKPLKDFKKSSNHFCTSSCAAKFNIPRRESIWTPELRNKMSAYAKKNYTQPIHIKTGTYKTCLICDKEFYCSPSSSQRKFCSLPCSYKNPNLGGYRENSTRLHRCFYNGIKMDSGSEAQFAELLDDNNIKWSKNTTTFFHYIYRGKNKKYYPDFYLEDLKLWVEIKGKFYIEDWLPNKIQSVKDDNQKIILIDSDHLKHKEEILRRISTESSRI